MTREKLPSLDELSAARPPKREGSADSFPIYTDQQAELVLNTMRNLSTDVTELNKNVLKVLERDAVKAERDTEQEKRLAELEAFREKIIGEAKNESSKTATRWSAVGTVIGIIIASAASSALTQCRWIPPGTVVQQQVPASTKR